MMQFIGDLSMTQKEIDLAHQHAVAEYANDDINVDSPTLPSDISEGDDGCWLKAWAWVPNKAFRKE